MADQELNRIRHREYARRYREKYPEKVKQVGRRSKLKKNYGITIEDYDLMLIQQKGQCLLCDKQFPNTQDINVDHDHLTGIVRGLLCTYCNIRMATVDNEQWLERAIMYRNKYRKDGN